MYGSFFFSGSFYGGTLSTAANGVLTVSDGLAVSDADAVLDGGIFVADFVFTDETAADTSPQRALTDTLRINEWLTVKSRRHSPWHD